MQTGAVKTLKAVNQHGTVGLVQYVPANLDDAVRTDPDQVAVERRVVEVTERDSVRYRRLTKRVRVRHDVRRLEQFLAFEATDAAVVLVGAYNSLAKRCLVQPLAEQAGRVSPPKRRLRLLLRDVAKAGEDALVDADGECQAGRIVTHDVDRPLRRVQAWHDSVEVDERNLLLHRQPEAHIFAVCRIRPAVSIAEQAIVTEGVVVRAGFTLDDGHSRDTQRDRTQNPGF